MKDTVYLVCGPDGIARMTKRAPSLYRHEVAVKVTVGVPDDCFRSWVFAAAVEVPEDRVIKPELEIEAVAETQETGA